MIRNRLAAAVVASVLTWAGIAQAQAPAIPRVVIELFTSQGCSSCPPADSLLAEFAKQPDVIALSLPVDYWDYLGWKDTLALAVHTKRQKGYSIARGDRQVYTPQAVINGVAHVVGSNRYQIDKASLWAHGRDGALSVPISLRREEKGWVVELPAAGDARAQIVVMPITKRCDIAIGRGENADKKITYTNVVRGVSTIGEWRGGAESVAIDPSLISGENIDGFVVLVQAIAAQGKPGAILGAAKSDGL
ncbi:MAG: hypothetical protein BGP06_21125 [Rhizobiales bacterium 65-9]|nr:DUF1223 domain-containing protein [Hyphomicrobiales bacterium]OJY36516.1 MAG: hypothetical protein BGP06_21125 [Rhizobiales bacterium 65-9]